MFFYFHTRCCFGLFNQNYMNCTIVSILCKLRRDIICRFDDIKKDMERRSIVKTFIVSRNIAALVVCSVIPNNLHHSTQTQIYTHPITAMQLTITRNICVILIDFNTPRLLGFNLNCVSMAFFFLILTEGSELCRTRFVHVSILGGIDMTMHDAVYWTKRASISYFLLYFYSFYACLSSS